MGANLLFTVFMLMIAFVFLAVNDRAESLDITGKLEGTVKIVKVNFIRVIETLNGKEEQVAIDTNTVYDNIQKLADLKAGDKVQIDYRIDHNRKAAITITKIEGGGF